MQHTLFHLIKWRCGKPLVITSNKSPKDIEAIYDDQIRGRQSAGTVLEIVGSDGSEGTGDCVQFTMCVCVCVCEENWGLLVSASDTWEVMRPVWYV